MDILLLIAGVFFLCRGKYSYVLTIIMVLTTAYLQLPIVSDNFFRNFLFPHNVQDAGLLLYMLFFIDIARRKGFTTKHPLTKYVHVFFLFLVFSGIYDIIRGTSAGDVIKYWRYWLLLSIVYIAPYISRTTVMQSFRQLFNITFWCSLLILFQRYTGITLIEMKDLSVVGRGIKPPSFSIYCAVLCLINFWKQSLLKRVFYFLVIMMPIILCLKMTYALSVAGIYLVYVFVASSWSSGKKIALSAVFAFGLVCFLVFNEKFSDRLIGMTREVSTIDSEEVSGNFSYRILHATERFDYIAADPVRLIRGLGFVSEQNFVNPIFIIGQYDPERDRITQLDTGDIAWSLLFLRLGVAGTILFLIFYLKIVRLYYKRSKESELNAYFFSMMTVFLVFTSLGNALITYDDFYVYPLLFLVAPVQRKSVFQPVRFMDKAVFE